MEAALARAVPFVQDGLRDGEHVRAWMTGEFQARLTETGRPWTVLTGPLERRVTDAVAACSRLIAVGRSFAAPSADLPALLICPPG